MCGGVGALCSPHTSLLSWVKNHSSEALPLQAWIHRTVIHKRTTRIRSRVLFAGAAERREVTPSTQDAVWAEYGRHITSNTMGLTTITDYGAFTQVYGSLLSWFLFVNGIKFI
uniref:Uncharacterized protein n=1 Tax=Knipowitschia caucasica TaxID=637954 RepID=A0AAV2KD35_KNICA